MKIITIILLFFVIGCTKVIQLDLPLENPRLVVHGLITNDTTLLVAPSSFVLSRSSQYIYKDTTPDYETGAKVILTDNIGNIDTLPEVMNGRYDINYNIIKGVIGRGYKVDIYTKEGQHYKSDFEVMAAVPPIDTIYSAYSPYPGNSTLKNYTIYADWQDPPNIANYYLWTAAYNYYGATHPNQNWFSVFNDKYINGEYIKNDIVNKGWTGDLGFNFILYVYSLSENAFNFWNLLQEQTIPAQYNSTVNSNVPLIGNVYNANNPNDYALGYFQVSAITVKTLKLPPW